jgi:hypothetical protein
VAPFATCVFHMPLGRKKAYQGMTSKLTRPCSCADARLGRMGRRQYVHCNAALYNGQFGDWKWLARLRTAVVSEGKPMNKKSIVEWRRRMKQFHPETQEGLGGFAAAIVRSEDVPAIAQSVEREAIAFTNAAIRWGAMIESGTWQLCRACEYKFRSAKLARAFVFMQPIGDEPTMAASSLDVLAT